MKNIEYPKEFLDPSIVLERIGGLNKRTTEMLNKVYEKYPDKNDPEQVKAREEELKDLEPVVARMMAISMSVEHFFKSREH